MDSSHRSDIHDSRPRHHLRALDSPLHRQRLRRLPEIEDGMSVNIQKDLDWLETELGLGQTKFLCGNEVTAADRMMQFSIDYIVRLKIGTQGRSWPNVEKSLKACGETETYRAAVKKTGHEIPTK